MWEKTNICVINGPTAILYATNSDVQCICTSYTNSPVVIKIIIHLNTLLLRNDELLFASVINL